VSSSSLDKNTEQPHATVNTSPIHPTILRRETNVHELFVKSDSQTPVITGMVNTVSKCHLYDFAFLTGLDVNLLQIQTCKSTARGVNCTEEVLNLEMKN
jgi:hypothetical protein